MPQARRKTPFSGKAKKLQLQNKKQTRTFIPSGSCSSSGPSDSAVGAQMLGLNARAGGRGERNRYALKFYRESEQELRQKKEDAAREVTRLPEQALEIDPVDYFPEELSFPQRPPWNFDMARAELEAQENKYFTEYVNGLQRSPLWQEMSYFELNLETWRQLWRVLEMSDVLLVIVDIRFPAMMFPPSLYKHVVNKCGKDMILVLNKIDLVPAGVVAAWHHHFTSTYPGLRVLYFTSCPAYNLHGPTADKAGLQIRRRKGRQRMAAEGATRLLEACRELVGDRVDLSSWEDKIREESRAEYDVEGGPDVGERLVEKSDTSYYPHERFKSGVLTIGCVGQPNVGKSSLMNSIVGRKVVSVSSTPGHTKHFQTIFLTRQVRLCDCPGLVFPSTVPRTVQILMGSYPIAQLREPYSAIRYLAERLDLPSLLRITHPEGGGAWSPRDVCDGWARKRGYFTAKAARLDSYRAANSLLRMALDGRICLALMPRGYVAEKAKWASSPEVPYIETVQTLAGALEEGAREAPDAASSDESDESRSTETGGDDEFSEAEPAARNAFAQLAHDE